MSGLDSSQPLTEQAAEEAAEKAAQAGATESDSGLPVEEITAWQSPPADDQSDTD